MELLDDGTYAACFMSRSLESSGSLRISLYIIIVIVVVESVRHPSQISRIIRFDRRDRSVHANGEDHHQDQRLRVKSSRASDIAQNTRLDSGPDSKSFVQEIIGKLRGRGVRSSSQCK